MSKRNHLAFAPNINARDRLLRGVGAASSATIGLLVSRRSLAAGVVLGATSLFLAFEALRGWCALRACGTKKF